MSILPPIRSCSVVPCEELSVASLRDIILGGKGVESDFSILTTPAPPRDQSAFGIIGNDSEILIGVALWNSLPQQKEVADTLELFMDLRHDQIGWFQYLLKPDGSMQEYSFQPYPEAHSSAFSLPAPTRHETYVERFSGTFSGWGCRWHFIWLDAAQFFRYGDAIGFNLVRYRPYSQEYSSWSFMSGNGAPDASSFGVLRRGGAAEAQSSDAEYSVSPASPMARFVTSITYDPPMCVIPNFFTPQRLRDELALLRDWGIQRIHWIENGEWPSFWRREPWAKNYEPTREHCGDLLRCAVEQAHLNNLELFADLKIFDLGFNMWPDTEAASGRATEIEGYAPSVIPEIAAHPEWTMQSNPAWRRETKFPIKCLRFFSEEPLPRLNASQIRLRVSENNRDYRDYEGTLEVRCGEIERPHQRWTPAGVAAEGGAARNWFLEISGLHLSTPYAAIEIEGDNLEFVQRGFMLMEAEDAEGERAPVTVATKRSQESGAEYSFWKEWPGWANVTEPLLQRRRWDGNDLGFTFQESAQMPALLEPTYEGARAIWLERVRRILDTGADGVSIRMLAHHNGIMNYLQFAFAPVVVETFVSLHGREPQSTPEDYERVRRIRGDALTWFLRDAKNLCAERGRKLGVHLESGIEVPPHLDTRMQIHLDYETWINEEIVDEVALKFWTPYSRWVHERVLSLARRRDIPVHIISRNMSNGFEERALETIPKLVEDARRLGFGGFNFYEAANIIEMNPAGVSLPRGLAEPTLRAVTR